mmetsp:Transcript_15177/g.49883  ORF Transcript_15177/g.49883 Transcript_15177/m.49883 type:complete len:234 (-) Transcript_15177:182-883(-)
MRFITPSASSPHTRFSVLANAATRSWRSFLCKPARIHARVFPALVTARAMCVRSDLSWDTNFLSNCSSASRVAVLLLSALDASSSCHANAPATLSRQPPFFAPCSSAWRTVSTNRVTAPPVETSVIQGHAVVRVPNSRWSVEKKRAFRSKSFTAKSTAPASAKRALASSSSVVRKDWCCFPPGVPFKATASDARLHVSRSARARTSRASSWARRVSACPSVSFGEPQTVQSLS